MTENDGNGDGRKPIDIGVKRHMIAAVLGNFVMNEIELRAHLAALERRVDELEGAADAAKVRED